MRMNGSSRKQSRLGLTSRLVAGSIAIVLAVLSIGCRAWKWTRFEYANQSDDRIEVEVLGIAPDPSPGVLLPGDGADQLSRVSLSFGDTVLLDDVIKIQWLTGNDVTEQHMDRLSMGLPSSIHGGTVQFTFMTNRQWTVTYSP